MPKGTLEELACFWNEELNITNIWSSDRVIGGCVNNNNGDHKWQFLACHGTPYNHEKSIFWEDIHVKLNNMLNPWLVFGDLNEITKEENKSGGRCFWKKRLYLKPILDHLGAIDLGFVGRKFTWVNNHTREGLIKQSLDRAFADQICLNSFPAASVTHL